MLINKRQGNEKGRGGWEKTLKNSKTEQDAPNTTYSQTTTR